MVVQRIDFSLTAVQRADARAALKLLAGTGLSLEEAAKRALNGKVAGHVVTVSQCYDMFFREKLRDGSRSHTVDWYESKLKKFVEKFGGLSMDTVTRGMIAQWLKSHEVSQATSAAYIRAARAMWRWAMAQDPQLAAVDATAGLRTSAQAGQASVEFLTTEECSNIMHGAGKYRSALALMLFAGVRPHEIASKGKPSLLWKHVNTKEHIVRIPADISKTGRARIMEGLPHTLWKWLKPGDADDPVCPFRAVEAVGRARICAGCGPKKPWPNDALRHSFATYHVAAFADPGKTATLLGHEGNPTMLYRHYRGLATKADAEKFWAIRP